MPLNCPDYPPGNYSDCLSCRHRHKNECWYLAMYPRKLRGILTVEERLAILEDNASPPVTQSEWTGNQWDYVQQLKGQVVFLTKKVNELLARKPKRKSKYLYK